MNAVPSPVRRGARGWGAIGGIAGFAVVLAGLAALGRWMLWSNFVFFDDEGYILLSAQSYFASGRLYEAVYSQYGPAYYLALDAYQRLLGAPIDHETTRLLTLLLWLGTAGSCAALVWRQTASRALACFTVIATFLYLYFLRDEPCHPGSVIIFVIAASTWVLTELIDANRWRAAAWLAGGSAAFLLLTKINVGGFYLVAVAGWALFNTTSAVWRRAAPALVAIVFIAVATMLMHTLWRESWIHIYLVTFAVGAITLALVMRGTDALGWNHAGHFASAGMAAGLSILLLVALRGTSVSGLIEGVLLGPLRHPANYSYAVEWRPGALVVAGSSLVLALVHRWLVQKRSAAAADRLIVLLRLGQTAGLLVALSLLIHVRIIGTMFTYIAPLIWTWVVPLTTADARADRRTLVRGLVAAVLLLQYLHAYPIGGSQESWGTFLFLPLVALGLAEIRVACGARAWPILSAALAGVLLAKAGWVAVEMRARHDGYQALDLPGAQGLRLPEAERTTYRALALNAAVHADALFSLPGSFSFNLWSGVPPPTAKNTTLWFNLLNHDEQRAIIRAMEAAPKTCIIVNEVVVLFMQQGNITATGPLRDYIYQNFTAAFRVGGCAFLVRSPRRIAPVGIARGFGPVAPDAVLRAQASRFEVCFAMDGTPITAIEARDTAAQTVPAFVLTAANATITATAIDSAGNATRPPTPESWPLRVKGLVRLSVTFTPDVASPAWPATTALYLKSSDGRTVHEARFAQ